MTDDSNQADSPRPQGLGHFDQSFFVRMIGSFLALLLAVALLEMALRFGFTVWEFEEEGPENVRVAAEQLASDVRSIMINEGGPVASRTIYPILDRNFQRADLEVAVEPSPATLESIEQTFDFTPRGIPADFPDGAHHEARVDLRADDLCLRCHVTADVGDVLGTVRVREYRSARLEGWWEEIRLTATVNLAKIVVHAVILFFLLRLLMNPLLSLRDAVSRLARGQGGLAVRARVASKDEFGELAADLNTFLDRISRVIRDLRKTISRMVTVNDRLAGVVGGTEEQLARVEEALQRTTSDERALKEELPRLVHEVHGLKHMIREVDFLEDHLCQVADSGNELLDRLLEDPRPTPPSAPPPDPPESPATPE